MSITFTDDCIFQENGNKKVTINTVDGVHHAKCECDHKWESKGVPKTRCDKCEFIKEYCEKSNVSWDELKKTQVILPCSCNDESCKGWAVVNNDTISIKTHNNIYV